VTRTYIPKTLTEIKQLDYRRAGDYLIGALVFLVGLCLMPGLDQLPVGLFFILAILPAIVFWFVGFVIAKYMILTFHRYQESRVRGGRVVLGTPPDRSAIARKLEKDRENGKGMISGYLVGFELETGEPMWISDDDICGHGCVFAKTGVGKTLWLESLILQQMARGRASGLTFIDAKRDSGTLADIIIMALVTGRIEDLVVIDPFDPVHAYNFVLTSQRADVKARKILRAGLPPLADSSGAKHYDRLAADSIYRLVRAMDATGLSWSMKDVAVSLGSFIHAYPYLYNMLDRVGADEALIELGHLFSSYADAKGGFNTLKMGDNLRGIASELNSIGSSDIGKVFTTQYTDLVLTADILRGKIIYYMLPRLEEAESAARMVKIFREDLEISIGEITSSRQFHLDDPHLVIVDEGSSTFGPTWANLFELARKGRFSILFGAQSMGGLTDNSLGLSEAFYERVMANVNLKVMMRIGDNKTAQEMAQWIGMMKGVRTSVGAGRHNRAGLASEIMPGLAGQSATMTVAEQEIDVVSEEELKHEMSAEKGLAWFDLGDGTIRKGRSFWFQADIPRTWEGREFLVKYEKAMSDGIGLTESVHSKILLDERKRRQREKSLDDNKDKASNNTVVKSVKKSDSVVVEKGSEPTESVAPAVEEPPRPFKASRSTLKMKRGTTTIIKKK
jgi:hypothetical protein